MAAAIAAYLHYLAIFLLFALLTLEHQLFKLPLDLARARSLMRIDTAYGVAAGLVLATGAARVLWYGKGLDYYLHNSVFHAKFGLFILVGLLSAVPTVVFLKWRSAVKAGEVPQVSAQQARLVTLVIRLELLGLLVLPLLAALMARGHGSF
ncbi:putative membrane protein [Pseudomonas sp. TE3786]